MFAFLLGKLSTIKDSVLVGDEKTQSNGQSVTSQPGKAEHLQTPSQAGLSQTPSAQQNQETDVQKILAHLDRNRKELLSSLLPSEILAWKQLREDKVEYFLQTTEKVWHNGPGDIQSRFDRTLAESCFGEYEGRIEYQTSDMPEPASYSLALKLTSLSQQEKGNKIALKSGKFGSFRMDFSADLLGTDSQSNSLSILWSNFNSSQSPSASHFVFYLRPNFQIGETVNEDLFGLDEKLKFQRIGSVALKKIR